MPGNLDFGHFWISDVRFLNIFCIVCFTSSKGHSNGHFRFGHCVHRTGDQGCFQSDLLGQGAHKLHLPGQEIDVARQQDEVIVRQALTLDDQLGACNAKQ